MRPGEQMTLEGLPEGSKGNIGSCLRNNGFDEWVDEPGELEHIRQISPATVPWLLSPFPQSLSIVRLVKVFRVSSMMQVVKQQLDLL